VKVDLKRFKIEKAASKDERRPVINNVFLDPANSVLVATDQYGMAVIPVRELAFDDTEGTIPPEAIQLARADQGKSDEAELTANGNVGVTLRGQLVEFERNPQAFPDWTEAMKTKGKPIATLQLSPKTLQQVAEAIGSGSIVKLEVYDNGKAIVTPVFYDDEFPMPRGLIVARTPESEAAAA
jgi:hypothetical protein